ncbi:MAG: GHKL domain-containing protein [Devosia sp.]|uniref:sensor histidine kinase n=1 Tax=Devosia sp. TaxID=1871048 RepID=UPI0024C8B322|nr:ATP-binding protein [Devosia sp.]UYN99272.1 MAG: GHKL domain-containing protein [Devosia sp.]
MDDSSPSPPISLVRSALERIAANAPLLLAVAVLVTGFVIFGGLRLELAIAGMVAITGLLSVLSPGGEQAAGTRTLPAEPGPGVTGDIAAFIEALSDPALVIDRRGEVSCRNAAATRQYPSLQPGRVLTLVLRNPELMAAVEATVRTGEVRSFQLHETLPSETWDRVTVSPLRLPGRDWVGDNNRQLLITFQSLTEFKRVESMRSDFIANASHELRTPLASLMGFIDTLLGPAAKDSAARDKFLGIMRGQADRMSRLIDDMLSLSRIEMHQHVRPTGSVDLSALLREVREGLQTQAQAAEIEVILNLPEGQAVVSGDRGQLYEVFENLLDNAMKYGATGQSVEITLTPVQRAGFAHLVSVVDHGPGVEPEHVPRMTERFYRIDAESSRKKKGTGLGLAIVKHIIQRHRGQMVIRSRANPGEGLRVEVLLP